MFFYIYVWVVYLIVNAHADVILKIDYNDSEIRVINLIYVPINLGL